MKNPKASTLPYQGIKFAVVGLANTAVDFTVFWVLVTNFPIPPLAANTLSYSAGVSNSFFLNKYWTFRSTTQRSDSVRQFSSFVLISIVSLALSNMFLWAAAFFLPLMLAKGVSILGTFSFNFLASRYFVFGGSVAP